MRGLLAFRLKTSTSGLFLINIFGLGSEEPPLGDGLLRTPAGKSPCVRGGFETGVGLAMGLMNFEEMVSDGLGERFGGVEVGCAWRFDEMGREEDADVVRGDEAWAE